VFRGDVILLIFGVDSNEQYGFPFFQVNVTDAGRAAFASVPTSRGKPHLSQSTCSLNDGVSVRGDHDENLQGMKVIIFEFEPLKIIRKPV